MKIRNETGSDRERLITPCYECGFFDKTKNLFKGECKLGKLEIYEEQDLVQETSDGPEILTFCSFARPIEWIEKHGTDQVYKDNNLRYDVILRITDPNEISYVDELSKWNLPPQKIVVSYTDLNTVDLIGKFQTKNVVLTKIFDNRADNEVRNCKSKYILILDEYKDYSKTIEELNERLQNIERIIACVNWPDVLFMRYLYEVMKANSLEFCEENLVQAGKDSNPKMVKRFDETSIRDYS